MGKTKSKKEKNKSREQEAGFNNDLGNGVWVAARVCWSFRKCKWFGRMPKSQSASGVESEARGVEGMLCF